ADWPLILLQLFFFAERPADKEANGSHHKPVIALLPNFSADRTFHRHNGMWILVLPIVSHFILRHFRHRWLSLRVVPDLNHRPCRPHRPRRPHSYRSIRVAMRKSAATVSSDPAKRDHPITRSPLNLSRAVAPSDQWGSLSWISM